MLKKATVLLFFLGAIALVNGQMYQPDPFLYEGFWGGTCNFEKQDIVKNRISLARLWRVSVGDDSIALTDSVLVYQVVFNKNFNPETIYYQFTSDYMNSKEVEKLLKRGRISTLQYTFHYKADSLLIQTTEKFQEAYSRGNYSKNDIRNYFDDKGRIVQQIIEEKIIYPKRTMWLRRNYPNDTTTISVYVNYKDGNVSSLYRKSTGYNNLTGNVLNDTVSFNCPFDSIFQQYPTHGVLRDSLDRIVQSVRYATHFCGSGGCHTPESPNDRIYTYSYNNNGRLSKIHIETRDGLWPEDEIHTYYSNGLPKAILYSRNNYLEVFEYLVQND